MNGYGPLPEWTNRVLFGAMGKENLRRGTAMEVGRRLKVLAKAAAVSSRGAGKWPEFVWGAGIFLRRCGVAPID
jgi:hypothetical protein